MVLMQVTTMATSRASRRSSDSRKRKASSDAQANDEQLKETAGGDTAVAASGDN